MNVAVAIFRPSLMSIVLRTWTTTVTIEDYHSLFMVFYSECCIVVSNGGVGPSI